MLDIYLTRVELENIQHNYNYISIRYTNYLYMYTRNIICVNIVAGIRQTNA